MFLAIGILARRHTEGFLFLPIKSFLLLGDPDQPDVRNGCVGRRSEKTEAVGKFGVGDTQPGNHLTTVA